MNTGFLIIELLIDSFTCRKMSLTEAPRRVVPVGAIMVALGVPEVREAKMVGSLQKNLGFLVI